MKTWNHITETQRRVILSGVCHGLTAKQIAESLDKHPTTISRELKKNAVIKSKVNNPKTCHNLLSYPFVCNGCSKKYTNCDYSKYEYNPKTAEIHYCVKKRHSRNHVSFDKESLSILGTHIASCIDAGLSVHQAIMRFDIFYISESAIYNLLKKQRIPNIDGKVISSYKIRKKRQKEYEYNENKSIDRTNRTYEDFLKYTMNTNVSVCEMDFLGKSRGKYIDILTLVIKHINYTLIFAVENKSSNKMTKVFNYLQKLLGKENFSRIFGVILTDREPSFSNFMDIEFDKEGEFRTRIFYCDPYVSVQKALVENRNRLLRKYMPRGTNNATLNSDKLRGIEYSINSLKSKTLSGYSPTELLEKVFGEDVTRKLTKHKFIF